MRKAWATTLALLAMVWAGPVAAASATDPVTLGADYVLDEAGVLSADQVSQAERSITAFRGETGLDLWVVFVDSFTSPSDPEEWANEVASGNGLGPTQYLLAVSVDGRQFYLSGDSAGPTDDDQLLAIEQERIQPQLADENWAGAIDAALAGLTDAVGGGASAQGGAGGGLITTVLVVVVVIVAIVLVVVLIRKRKKQGSVTGGGQPALEDLERLAGSALVQMDDAVRTSEEELGFARAQFGDQATTEFSAALDAAKESLNRAFALKQQLDDSVPDSEEQKRAWNGEIVQLCEQASTALDEKAEAFDELRKLEQNAPEALARVQEQRAAMEPRIARAQAALAELGARYAPAALSTVADNPEQARQRLAFADEQLTAAQQDIGAGKGGEAAVGIRAAEEAVGQAGLLSDAVGKLGDDLAKAEASIAELVANLQQDIATAQTLPDADGRMAGAIASTRQAVATATGAASGSGGLAPLQVLASLEAANTQIDGLVASVRDEQEAGRRAQQQLGQAIMQAQAQVSAAEDYITARRGAVGAEARTRLAEAGASLVQAQQLQASDPQQALAQAQRAAQLAGQAIQHAQSDVGGFDGGGMFGGGGSGGGGNMMGAVLGGIVINSLLSGGGRRGGGMPSGLGGFGGGRASRGAGPGSFGGGGTRSRRGGGRF
ncbi:MAG: TPM domain-containing protein [Microbacterium sp.]|uniref:TPM domain-containing protein n=1 Tax=Microbacterium sp. TaxID=51671 RepID=UPI0039E234C5